MGAAIGTDDKKSVNVELNIVPFIDLMSCLTAFLLVTAVWVNIAQLSIAPSGKSFDGLPCDDDPTCDKIKLSVLVEPDQIWIGVSRVDEFEVFPKTGGAYDWAKVEAALKAHKESSLFVGETKIEIAAHSSKGAPVEYQHLIAAMDIAVKTGFVDVGVTDAAGLSARPRS